MALTNSYLQGVYETVQKRNPNEPEFQQAVYEVLESLQPVVEARPAFSVGHFDPLVLLRVKSSAGWQRLISNRP